MTPKDIIKQALTPKQVLQHYGVEFRGNRCKCPIHGGNDYNMAVNASQAHCFVCSTSVDIFAFVMHRFSVSFPEALRILNEDFHLGVDIDAPVDMAIIDAQKIERKKKEEYRQYKLNLIEGQRYLWVNFGIEPDGEPLSYERWSQI